MAYTILRRPWRLRRVYVFLMAPELAAIVALLVLFGLSQPDTYRTLMWQIGYENGFNSNPKMILYAYANHVPLPKIPFVWSQSLTDLNVAISVLSLFLLLAKMIALIMHVFYPVFGLAMSVAMVALYTTSVYGQAGPDDADARYPSHTAWYIAKSCSYAKAHNAVSDCLMAKGSFAATVLMLVLYLANLGFAMASMWPNKAIDLAADDDDDDDDGRSRHHHDSDSENGVPAAGSKQWEMQPQPLRSPQSIGGGFGGSYGGGYGGGYGAGGMASPFTPRTQAFHTLDRKLPLRA